MTREQHDRREVERLTLHRALDGNAWTPITLREHLCAECGLNADAVRSALARLYDSGMLAINSDMKITRGSRWKA